MPTTSGPRLRYSSASLSICASPMSWISWAVLVGGGEEPQRRGVRRVAVGQPAQAAPVVGARLRQHLVAQHVAVGRHPGAYVGLDHLAQPGLPAVDVHPGRRRRRWRSSGSSATGVASMRVDLGDRVGDRERGREPPVRHALALPIGQLAVVATEAAELVDQRLGHVGVRAARASPSRSASRPARRRSGRRRARRAAAPSGRRGVVASAISTARVIRCCSSRPASSSASARGGEVAQRGDLAVLGLARGLLERPGAARSRRAGAPRSG